MLTTPAVAYAQVPSLPAIEPKPFWFMFITVSPPSSEPLFSVVEGSVPTTLSVPAADLIYVVPFKFAIVSITVLSRISGMTDSTDCDMSESNDR